MFEPLVRLYIALGAPVLTRLFKWWLGLTLTFFTARLKFGLWSYNWFIQLSSPVYEDVWVQEVVMAHNSTLGIAYRFISNLWQLRQGVDFGSVVELWMNDPAAWVWFSPNSWKFFQPNLLCFVLCWRGVHVVRWGLSPRLDLVLHQNGLILRQNGFPVIINDDFLEEGGCYGR